METKLSLEHVVIKVKQMDVVQVVGQTISTLEFKWDHIEHRDVYKVVKKVKNNEWKIVYW